MRTCIFVCAGQAATAPRAGGSPEPCGASWAPAWHRVPTSTSRIPLVGFGEETVLLERLLWKKGQLWARRLSDSLQAGRGREVAGRL